MFERKYSIHDNKLIKISNGVPIPGDEPVIVFRAKDRNALPVLVMYVGLCTNLDQKQAFMKTVNDFKNFRNNNPDKMGEPTP